MADITISLDNGDNARVFDKNQLLQANGYDAAVELLKKSLDDARIFGHNGVEDHRSHDAIFIDGPRGSGKTAFLLNLENYFEKDSQYKDKIHFCSPIDPTLLENKDRFLNIVIGKLHAEAKKKLAKTPSQQQYYAALEAVGAALASFDEAGEVTGVDRILAHKSSIGLHHELVRYYRQVCKVLECDAVVLLVDDVDMALEHAYDILDVVRRHLACPLIIPVVTGDLTMYQYIVGKKFKTNLDVKDNDFDTIDLAEQYLKKVLPTHRRIRLLGVQDLIDQHNITISYKNKELPFQRFYDFIKHLIYLRTNGEENSHPSFMPDSTRGLIQFLLRTAPIIEIAGNLVYDEQSQKKREIENNVRSLAISISMEKSDKYKDILKLLNSYWKSIENWPAYERGNADLLIASSTEDIFPRRPLSEIIWFNPLRHPKKYSTYPWDKEVRKINYNINSVNERDFNYTLVPMPSLEPYSNNAIFNKSLTNKIENDMQNLYIRLFSCREYYSSYQTTNLIFFGRAWELLIVSLFNDITEEYLVYILSKPPYFSIFQALPTKRIDVNEDDLPVNKATESDGGYLPRDAVNIMVTSINKWREEIKPIKPSAQLIYQATNKAFNAFNNMKIEKIIGRDSVFSIIQRFMLVAANSFPSFELNTLAGEGPVVQISIGEGEAKKIDNYKNNRAYSNNISSLLDRESVTNFISKHPIFSILGMSFNNEVNKDHYDSTLCDALRSSLVKSTSDRSSNSDIINYSIDDNSVKVSATARSLDHIVKNVAGIGQRTLKNYAASDGALAPFQIKNIENAITKIIYNQDISENKNNLQKYGSSFFASLYAAASKHNLSDIIDEWLNS